MRNSITLVVVALCLSLPVLFVAQVPQESEKTPAPTNVPTYPIATEVCTTVEKTIVPLPHGPKVLLPKQVSEYAPNHYGEWNWEGPSFPYVRPNMVTGEIGRSIRDPQSASLLSFFTMSDVHIVDKESPTQVLYMGYENKPGGNSSAYSAVILFSPHVLDAAVQTINALHKKVPLDFGISLGDATNNTQYNELRWYIDVLDGKLITPSSGAHLGADTTLYQKPFQAAGLDKSLPWYQVIGNHDLFWMGSASVNDYLRQTYIGTNILNIGPQNPPPFDFTTRGLYMGVVDGTTEFGDVIYAGPTSAYPTPPQIVADPTRRSLLLQEWMSEFLVTTSQPAGHGFTQEMIRNNLACYSFHPRSNIPLKVIVIDDTDKVGEGAAAALDYQRYGWLVKELDAGESAGELMIVCAHIPIRPYAQGPGVPPYQPWSLWSPRAEVSEQTVLDKLHTYKNLILWISGHVHRNAITPQPSPDGNPENGFWEVETPSLRDFPQQFRRFEIVRNSDNNISIFALSVDPAANWTPLADGSSSPAWISRSYAVATQQIFNNPIGNGPHVDPNSGVYNAELIKQLSPVMQAKLAQLSPVVKSFKIVGNTTSSTNPAVTLTSTVIGSVPTEYMASEFASFSGAVWRSYAKELSFTLSSLTAAGTVYFKVKDGSGRQSAVVSDTFTNVPQIQGVTPSSVMVNTNHSATLTVACTGGVPLTFQWYEGTSGDTTRPMAGATQVLFRTPGILADTKFWVRVSNGFGHADSPAVPVVLWNRYYIPHATAASGWWSRIRMVNAAGASGRKESVPTTLANISAYAGDGTLLETKTVTIPGMARYTADIRDLFSPASLAEDLWLKIEAKAELKGLTEFGTADFDAQTALPYQEDPAKSNVFPFVAMTGDWYTGITLVNTATKEAEVRLTAYSESGLKLGEKNEIIVPNGKFVRLVSEVFSTGIDPLAIRSIAVESTQPLVGFELFGNVADKGLAGLPIVPKEEKQLSLLSYGQTFPALPGRADWQTRVILTNQDEFPATIMAQVYDAAGTELGTEVFNLNPRQQMTREAWELFPASKYAGMAYFLLRSNQRIAGFELVLSRATPFRFDSLLAFEQPANRQIFPMAPADSLFGTNLRLINGIASASTLTVKAYSAAGVLLGSYPVALSAHAKRDLNIRAAIPSVGNIAWLLVEGDKLFTAHAFILSSDNQRLITFAGMPVN